MTPLPTSKCDLLPLAVSHMHLDPTDVIADVKMLPTSAVDHMLLEPSDISAEVKV